VCSDLLQMTMPWLRRCAVRDVYRILLIFRGYSNKTIVVRNMNSLQEASRIYKAFKKGGPSFGAWQVRSSRGDQRSDLPDGKARCSPGRTILEPLPALGLTGYVWMASMETLMVRQLPVLSP
jgi:hypothetical protein